MRQGCKGVLYVFLAFLLFHCKDQTGTLYLPETLDRNYSLAFNDTTRVNTSTILLDSVPNSNMGTILIGKYKDDRLGVIESKPFFQMVYGSNWVLDPEATYDSAELLMNYSKYYYGDTTKSQTVEVRGIASDLKTFALSKFWINLGLFSYLDVTAGIYNNRSFPVNSTLLGSTKYIPRPKSNDTIRVRLDDNLTKDFFQQKLANSIFFRDPYRFIEFYFKGLSINSVETSNIVGINPTKIKLRIYYKERVNDKLQRKYFDFLAVSDNSIYPVLLYYNNIIADRSSTPLASLSPSNEISSTLTNDESYIQSGVGVVTKLTFPGLLNVATLPGFKQLTSARLILEPIKDSYSGQNYLPTRLELFSSNRTNIPFGPLSADYANGTQVAYLQTTLKTENATGYTYTFKITQYLQSLLSTKSDFRDAVLLLSTSPTITAPTPSNPTSTLNDNMYGTVTRLSIGNGRRAKYRARIEIYYLKQNN